MVIGESEEAAAGKWESPIRRRDFVLRTCRPPSARWKNVVRR